MSSHTAQISVFIDTEFTHLCDALNPEPAVLISIGAVAQDGEQHFYAENEDTQLELCSGFTMETVLPLLEGGEVRMPYGQIARLLREWVESLDGQVEFWSDSPIHDWPFVQHMFDTYVNSQCNGQPLIGTVISPYLWIAIRASPCSLDSRTKIKAGVRCQVAASCV